MNFRNSLILDRVMVLIFFLIDGDNVKCNTISPVNSDIALLM